MNFYTTTILVLALFYILLLIIVFFFQGNLLYHPTTDNYIQNQVEVEPAEIEKVKITTKDKINLIGWYYNRNLEEFKTILFFHVFVTTSGMSGTSGTSAFVNPVVSPLYQSAFIDPLYQPDLSIRR